MDRPLIVKSNKCKEGLSFDLSHEDVVEQLLPMFKKELKVLEDKLCFDFNYGADDYCNDIENLIEHFNAKSLEGEEVYVVLSEDLIEGE